MSTPSCWAAMTFSQPVLVDGDRRALLHRALVGATGEVAEEEDLEGELDILLGALAGRTIGDIDALTRRDRTDMIFHGCRKWIGARVVSRGRRK